MTDAEESELLWMNVFDRYPQAVCGIVGSLYLTIVGDMDQEVHINGVDAETTIHIDIGTGIEIFHVINIKACLLFDLTPHTFLCRLIHIHETAWQVKGALGWFFGTTHH